MESMIQRPRWLVMLSRERSRSDIELRRSEMQRRRNGLVMVNQIQVFFSMHSTPPKKHSTPPKLLSNVPKKPMTFTSVDSPMATDKVFGSALRTWTATLLSF